MKFYLLVVSLLVNIGYQAFGQVTVGGLQRNSLDVNNTARGMMVEIKAPEKEAIGSTYIDDNWVPGKIEFANGQVLEEDFLLRYDISMDQIEVKIDGGVKGVKGHNLKSFAIFNPTIQGYDLYINASTYQEAGVKHTGFFKVITAGEWSLLEKTTVTLEKPSYNPVLDVGEEEPKYVKHNTMYMAQNNSTILVSKNKKDFLHAFGDQAETLASYMKEEKLSLKKIEDLQQIVGFLNKKS